MIALGSNAHLFARPHRRDQLRSYFEETIGSGPVATVNHPGMAEPMLLVRFPDGGSLSIEFTADAPDSDEPRLGTWLELRSDDPDAVVRATRSAGLSEVHHPGHTHYVMIPGGQVFAVIPA